MRFIIFLLTLVMLGQTSFAQPIDYSIPQGYGNGISKKDYRRIVDQSVSVIAERYRIDFVKDGTIRLKPGQDMQAFNLHNLMGTCVAVADKNQWGKVIEAHFENMFASIDAQKKIDYQDFESVRKYLSIRIYPRNYVGERGGAERLVLRTDLEGTYTVLMLDLPGAFTPVNKSVFAGWNKTESDVFKIAQGNVNGQTVEKVTRTFPVDGGAIELTLLGNEDYAASYALDLANNSSELVGEWGSVIAIPNKGLVNICKISRDKPLDFVKFIQYTKATIEKFHAQHPQPISDQYFWYYKGTFTHVHVTTDADGNTNVMAPMGLSELMTEKK